MLNHIGFIMDGNRRFAKKNNLTLKEAYKKGMEQFLDVINFQIQNKIKHTSFFALSTHNYSKRKKEELEPIAELVKEFFNQDEIEEFFLKNKIKISLRGNQKGLEEKKEKLDEEQKSFITTLEKRFDEFNSKLKNPKFFVHVALNYDGQEELVNAFNSLIEKRKKDISIEDIKNNLYFNDVPSPDVIVRPGDAPRISGFLLFDSAYSEMYFSKKLWPELNDTDLENILKWFSNQQRNFGK